MPDNGLSIYTTENILPEILDFWVQTSMFVISSSSNIEQAERGISHYKQIYHQLLSIDLNLEVYKLGVLNLHVLRGNTEELCLIVEGRERTVALLGYPSCLASDGDIEAFVRRIPEDQRSVDLFKQKLQGDFEVVVVNHDAQQWEASIDSVGLGNLYYTEVMKEPLAASHLYLLASCVPLTLDHETCALFDLCGFMYGDLTIFKDTFALEMDSMLSVKPGKSWAKTSSYHYVEVKGPAPRVEDIAQIYIDAARPRWLTASTIRHCMSGGADSRIVLALMSYAGIKPVVYAYGGASSDERISRQLAAALEFTYLNTKDQYLFAQTESDSMLAEALVLDGVLRVPLTKRNYLFNMGYSDLLTTGNFGELATRAIWAIGYAGINFPTHEKIIDRLSSVLIRPDSHPEYFAEDPRPVVRTQLTSILRDQAKRVPAVDQVKLCNYFYSRNRAGRWASASLSAVKHFTRIDYPLGYAAGVAETWKLPSSAYKNHALVRQLLGYLDRRLTLVPFEDGTPAHASYSMWDRAEYIYHKRIIKGIRTVQGRLISSKRKTAPNSKGLTSTSATYNSLPVWARDDNQRHTLSLYKFRQNDLENVNGIVLKTMYTLEFAARIYEGLPSTVSGE